jgi:hypothetical protein
LVRLAALGYEGPIVTLSSGILQAAVDESGTHGGPRLAVAACIAYAPQWRAFYQDWLPYAQKYIAGGGYHATDADKADNIALGHLIHQRLLGVAVTISYEDYKEAVPRDIKSHFGGIYVAGLRSLQVCLRTFCENEAIRWVKWILERGHKEQNSADQFLTSLGDSPANRYWSHEWVGKENLLTHAADLVAYLATVDAGNTKPIELMLDKTVIVLHFRRQDFIDGLHKGRLTIARRRWLKAQLKKARKLEAAG